MVTKATGSKKAKQVLVDSEEVLTVVEPPRDDPRRRVAELTEDISELLGVEWSELQGESTVDKANALVEACKRWIC